MAKLYAARRPGTVAVRLDLAPEARDQLRVLAAQAGLPMSEYVRQIVEKEIAKKAKNLAK